MGRELFDDARLRDLACADDLETSQISGVIWQVAACTSPAYRKVALDLGSVLELDVESASVGGISLLGQLDPRAELELDAQLFRPLINNLMQPGMEPVHDGRARVHEGDGLGGEELGNVGRHLHAHSAAADDGGLAAALDVCGVLFEIGDAVELLGPGQASGRNEFRACCYDLFIK